MKRYIIPILLWLGFVLPAVAQSVTYNADERKPIPPHRTASVELYSKSKGVLLPKVDCATRKSLSLTAAAMGLIVYQTDSLKGLYEFDGLEWRCLNPMEITDDSGVIRQLHRLALSGKYLDLQDRPNIPQSISDLSEVAFSGNYNDLDDRPNIPDLPSSSSGEQQSFARVALTGDYLDLMNRPRIPQSIHDLSEAAFSGSYADLETKIPIPTALSELEQDESHQTIEDDDAATWDALSAMSVPTKLSQLETDYNNHLVTEKEIQTWDGIEHRDIPRRASEFEQNEFYRTVTAADKAKWNEAADTPYPTMLRDLQQDGNHLVVTEKEKAEWDAAAQRLSFTGRYDEIQDRPQLQSVALTGSYGSLSTKMQIPTDLSEFERNEYYSLVTLSEWESWNLKSEFKGSYHDLLDTPRIATRIADLKADYEAMTISNNDRNQWDNMAAVMDSSGWFKGSYSDLKDKPKIPTALSDLIQDTAAMTVSATYTPAGERQIWDGMTDLHNSIGLFVSDYTSDDLHQTVSYADTTRWNADARRIIPDSLRHLELEDGTQWATDSLRAVWNGLTTTFIISDDTINNLQQLTYTLNQNSVSWFAGAETLKNTTDRYTGLTASLLPVAYTGDYNDLKNSPAQVTLMDSATLAPLSHLHKVATSGDYDDLGNKPALSLVTTSGDYDDLDNLPTTTGVLSGSFKKKSSLNNIRNGFTLKDNPEFSGKTTVSGSISVGKEDDLSFGTGTDLTDATVRKIDAQYNIKVGEAVSTDANHAAVANYLSSVATEKSLNAQWLKDAKDYTKDIIIPEGMVVMWYGNENKIPHCWKRYTGTNGRFPVCINNGENGYENNELLTYQPKDASGYEKVTLTEEHLPPHSHSYVMGYSKIVKKNSGNGESGMTTVSSDGGRVDEVTSDAGSSAAFDIRPPFYAIYFIVRDNENCPSN